MPTLRAASRASMLRDVHVSSLPTGGVVVNSKGEVLMVVEKFSPAAAYQGCWKLPGGLADPGEHFVDTVAREVREETGVVGELSGVVSLRHSHNFRFGQVRWPPMHHSMTSPQLPNPH